MPKKTFLFIVIFLFFTNIVCWQEVFALSSHNYLEVNFLAVGQGDSAFIRTPENHQIIIDGGPGNAALKKLSSLMPFWDRTIDLVILSHPEKDHMQGLLSILQKYKADYILWTGVFKNSPEYDVWMSVLEKQKKTGAEIIITESGQKIRAGNVLIETLFPLKKIEGTDVTKSANDTSVVSKVTYGSDSFLFMGDISSGREKEIMSQNKNLMADVLKVAHHGSKYSTSEVFLSALEPMVAVIEVGKNSYGHPTQEVLQRLEKFGIKVLRTDINGDIKFMSDGNKIKIQ